MGRGRKYNIIWFLKSAIFEPIYSALYFTSKVDAIEFSKFNLIP